MDREGRARVTTVALPSAARRNPAIPGSAEALRAPEDYGGSYSNIERKMFSFGMIVIEVRPMYPATSSVGGGEMGDLSSAKGFYGKASVQSIYGPSYFFEDLRGYATGSSGRDAGTWINGLVVGDDGPLLAPRPCSATKYDGNDRPSP